MDQEVEYNSRNQRLCGAYLATKGRRCRGVAITGSNRCRRHGGRAESGVFANATVTGRYSGRLPKGLESAYDRLLADPTLADMRQEAALLATRVHDLVGRLEDGESYQRWQMVKEAWKRVRIAQVNENKGELAVAMSDLNEVITAGGMDYLVWNDINAGIHSFRQINEYEQKRQERARTMVSAESAVVFASALVGQVEEHVKDDATRQAIFHGLVAVMEVNKGLTVGADLPMLSG